MKYYTGDAVFHFNWDQVVQAFWQRYPNPYSKHVLSEDVIERRMVGSKLFTKRIICKTNSLPKWGEKFVTGYNRFVYVLEESIVDRASQTFTTYTRNIGMQKIMSIDEKCVYTPKVENKSLVQCDRQAWISSGIYGFTGIISSFGANRFKKNAGNAVLGYNHVLQNLFGSETLLTTEQKTKKEKIRESAKKASEMAKSGAEKAKSKVPRPVLPTHCEG